MALYEKSYNCKVLRLVETDDFDIRNIPIQSRMQKLQEKPCATAMFGRIIRAGVRLIREIEAPKTIHNRHINLSSFTFTFIPLPCSSSSSFFVRSSSLQGGEPRGHRGDQVDIGQPIAAARPDGVPPGCAGFRV